MVPVCTSPVYRVAGISWFSVESCGQCAACRAARASESD